ncbi:hypothetical protein Pmani_000134, partial [Petrolisthes manimaculis]
LLALGVTHGQNNNNNNNKNGEEEGGVTEAPAPTSSTRPPLTGNPQIDYKYDPNLPHELLGYNLDDYPFYNRLPKDLLDPSFNFTCDDRHDGFYASIPHKCQVYHNCLFNQRYDFLCANYTVFDQKNFICHYVSEVDCENSWKHYDRNNDLYETTTTTTTTTPAPQIIYVQRPPPLNGPGRRSHTKRPNKRRTTTTTPPPEEYYDNYYDDYYYDEYYEYDEKTTTTTTTARPRRRPPTPRPGGRPRGRPGGRPGGRPRPGRPGDESNPRRGSRIQGNGGRPRDQNLPQGELEVADVPTVPEPVEDQATAATQIDRSSPVTNSNTPRVNVRRKPLDSSSGPKFPPRRSSAAAAAEVEGDTKEAPLNQDPTPTAIDSERETTRVRSRVRMPRPRKTPTTTSLPVEYDYY